MNQSFPPRFPAGGNVNLGNIHIEVPIAGDIVQVGHGNLVIHLQVLGVQDTTLRLDQQKKNSSLLRV